MISKADTVISEVISFFSTTGSFRNANLGAKYKCSLRRRNLLLLDHLEEVNREICLLFLKQCKHFSFWSIICYHLFVPVPPNTAAFWWPFSLWCQVLSLSWLLYHIHISPPKKEGKFDEQGTQIWRLVQDLCKVNAFIIMSHPVVPNPRTILNSISVTLMLLLMTFSLCPHTTQFMVFVYLYLPRQFYTWTRLPQRYYKSHTFFFQCLKWHLVCVTPLSLGSVYGQSSGSFFLIGDFPGVHTPSSVCFGQ